MPRLFKVPLKFFRTFGFGLLGPRIGSGGVGSSYLLVLSNDNSINQEISQR